MWTVDHSGPGGVLSRAHFPEWNAAANWLRAMMEVSRPDGVSAAMLRLRSATPDASFLASISGHRFSLSVAGQAQTDLFPLGAESAPVGDCAFVADSSQSSDALLDPTNSGAGREVWNTALPASFLHDTSTISPFLPDARSIGEN